MILLKLYQTALPSRCVSYGLETGGQLNWLVFGIFRITPRHRVCSASKFMSSRSRILWLNTTMVFYQLVSCVGFCSSYGSFINGEFSVRTNDLHLCQPLGCQVGTSTHSKKLHLSNRVVEVVHSKVQIISTTS